MSANDTTTPFRFRRFDPAHDFPALVHLINAIDAVDQSGEPTTEAEQRAQEAWPGRDLVRDRWVVTAADGNGELLGYGDSWKMPTTPTADIYVSVRPEWRRRGLGRELLRRTLLRAGEQGATHVAVYADATNPAPHPFLRHHGFAVAGAFVELHIALTHTVEAPQWPAGYTLRRFGETPDLALLVDVLNRSYADRFGHKMTTGEDIRDWLAPESAANILLVRDGQGKLVGICRVRPSNTAQTSGAPGIGFLDAPGVVPSHRQFGLYRSLVRAGMALLQQQQQAEIVLQSWGDEEHTIAEYCELGFARQRHLVAYRRGVVQVV